MKDYFEFSKYGANTKTEIIAGITTFLATMYIIVVNPAIISETGMSFSGVLTATILVSAFSSIMMGIYANNPIVVAPGMGLNAFFAFTVVLGMGHSWQFALTAVFLEGIIFILLTAFNIRELIVNAIPLPLKHAVSAGIGLFIAFIGLQNSGIIVNNDADVCAPKMEWVPYHVFLPITGDLSRRSW